MKLEYRVLPDSTVEVIDNNENTEIRDYYDNTRQMLLLENKLEMLAEALNEKEKIKKNSYGVIRLCKVMMLVVLILSLGMGLIDFSYSSIKYNDLIYGFYQGFLTFGMTSFVVSPWYIAGPISIPIFKKKMVAAERDIEKINELMIEIQRSIEQLKTNSNLETNKMAQTTAISLEQQNQEMQQAINEQFSLNHSSNGRRLVRKKS